jgi:hypothetical protein
MMARLKVRVTKIEAKRGQSGSYAIVHLEGGRRGFVWDKALVQTLSTPGVYELEAEERRGFLRIVAAHPVAANNETQGQSQAQGPDAQGHDTQGRDAQEASMAPGSVQERMVALQTAVALAPHLGLRDVAQVLTVAEKMWQWLQKGGR